MKGDPFFEDGETRRGVGWGRGALLGSDGKRHRGRSLGVAGGAISRTSKHGPWSRFGEEAGDFRFAFWGPSARGAPKGHCLARSHYLIWAPVVACGHRSVLGGCLFLFMVVGQLVFWSGSRQLAALNLQPLFPRSVPCKQGP